MSNDVAQQSKFGPDKEIWRETPDDAYAPSIHVTGNGLIKISVGGRVITRSIREWHNAVSKEIDFPGKYPSGG